jgi:hypothetical protein
MPPPTSDLDAVLEATVDALHRIIREEEGQDHTATRALLRKAYRKVKCAQLKVPKKMRRLQAALYLATQPPSNSSSPHPAHRTNKKPRRVKQPSLSTGPTHSAYALCTPCS